MLVVADAEVDTVYTCTCAEFCAELTGQSSLDLLLLLRRRRLLLLLQINLLGWLL